MKTRKPNRLKEFDYSTNGCYFITICTHNRVHLFGEIMNNQMELNETGKIAQRNWESIPLHFENVLLDEYIVMPNHIHGIIGIIDNELKYDRVANMRPLQRQQQIIQKNDRSKMLISKIVQQYKASVTRDINRIFKTEFKWQRSFYDHIIRNDISFENIRSYIKYNPMKWEQDIENRKNENMDSKTYYSGIYKS